MTAAGLRLRQGWGEIDKPQLRRRLLRPRFHLEQFPEGRIAPQYPLEVEIAGEPHRVLSVLDGPLQAEQGPADPEGSTGARFRIVCGRCVQPGGVEKEDSRLR